MTFTETDRRRPTRAQLLTIVGMALVIVVAVVLGVRAISASPAHERQSIAVAPTTKAPVPPPTAADTLILPSPTGQRNGIPVGFPHTTDGAVAAEAFDIVSFDSLDIAVAQTWVNTVAAPGSASILIRQVTRGVAVMRAAAGLPATGPVSGSFITYIPRAYQVADVTSDRLVVWVLARESAASNGSVVVEQPVSLGFVVVWVNGDWRLSADDPGSSPPADEPDSVDAVAHGWRALAEAR